MSLPIILLAAQAAGIATDLYSTRQAQKNLRRGQELEAAQTEKNLEQLRLQNTEVALQDLDKLRKNLSTQRAIAGARGQMSGVGSARAASLASERAFTSDERARELSLRFKTFDINQDLTASKLANKAQRKQLNQGFFTRSFQQLSSNQLLNGLNSFGSKLNLPKGEKL
jgi:hypothetical protein